MLPQVIEITPVRGESAAQVTIPGSKSITNRALLLAALGLGTTRLEGALWSEDTQVMAECLRCLGFEIQISQDPGEPCNRIVTVAGRGGQIPNGGTAEKPLDLFVGNAGTAARFLAAFVCLGTGVYRVHGIPRMHERPQASLFAALRALGYRVESANDRLPAVIFGHGARHAACSIDVRESSQFASALLLSAGAGGWQVRVQQNNPEEMPYVTLTEKLIGVFPTRGGAFQIEADASSAGYFWAADHLLKNCPDPWHKTGRAPGEQPITAGHDRNSVGIAVRNWRASDWQVDSHLHQFLNGGFPPGPGGNEREVSRSTHLGDSIMTAIVLAPFWKEPTRFTDLGRLRVQECERVQALHTELERCGAKVREEEDTLTVFPSPLHGAEIQTYNDHRIAMCFGTLGLKVPGLKIRNPDCVKKTFPNFFQKLAQPAPDGLGVVILDAQTGRTVPYEQLIAS